MVLYLLYTNHISIQQSWQNSWQKSLNTFELIDKDHSSILSETDPDLHYFNSFNQFSYKCNIFLQSKFNITTKASNITHEDFSLCHINIRSLRKNLTECETYLQMLSHKFTIIGFTETWLSEADSEFYGPNRQHFTGKHRNSKGGGVAVCVQNHLSYFERPDNSILESDMESVFIETAKINYKSTKIFCLVLFIDLQQQM